MPLCTRRAVFVANKISSAPTGARPLSTVGPNWPRTDSKPYTSPTAESMCADPATRAKPTSPTAGLWSRASRICIVCPTSVPPPPSTSNVHPYADGVVTRWSSPAAYVRAATRAHTPITAPNTAARPRPATASRRGNAHRTPIRGDGGRAPAMRSKGPTYKPLCNRGTGCHRYPARAAALNTTTINTSAPGRRVSGSNVIPGGGPVRRATAVGNNGDANVAPARARTVPAEAAGTNVAAASRARPERAIPMA